MTKHFSPEYQKHVSERSPSWLMRRWLCLSLLLWRDCIFPLLPASQADHITYRNLGHELPWRDIVPLNRHTHAFITWLRALPRSRKGKRRMQFVLAWLLRFCYGFWIWVEFKGIVFAYHYLQQFIY